MPCFKRQSSEYSPIFVNRRGSEYAQGYNNGRVLNNQGFSVYQASVYASIV